MKKKSPLKMEESNLTGTTSNGNSGINTSINYNNNLIKGNEQYVKNDRNNRV